MCSGSRVVGRTRESPFETRTGRAALVDGSIGLLDTTRRTFRLAARAGRRPAWTTPRLGRRSRPGRSHRPRPRSSPRWLREHRPVVLGRTVERRFATGLTRGARLADRERSSRSLAAAEAPEGLATRRSFVESDFTDEEWQLLLPLVQEYRDGRMRSDYELLKVRRAFDGNRYKFAHGVPWTQLPDRYGSWTSIRQRYVNYRDRGDFARMLDALRGQPGAAGLVKWLESVAIK